MSCYRYSDCKWRIYTDAILKVTRGNWKSVLELQRRLRVTENLEISTVALRQLLDEMHNRGYLARDTRQQGKKGRDPIVYRNLEAVWEEKGWTEET